MGNPKAFYTIKRKDAGYRPVHERVADYGEVEQTLNEEDRQLQASRCMDCGIPFCTWSCPLGNIQPEWQHLLYLGKWREAFEVLESTDDFSEFTGRVCPAPCEHGCVLNIHKEPVTIRENEVSIIEHAFAEGYVVPKPPKTRTGKKVAVIGSGPTGLACANQLNKRGHLVTVYEKDEAIGGLLRFGIPDFKLNKKIIDRRLAILEEEGIKFVCNAYIGVNVSIEKLVEEYDAICIAIGAGQPRDIQVEGRNLKGIHFALDYLQQQNRVVSEAVIPEEERIFAKGKHVLVIGGGDTGSDCVGTANRQGAVKITQIEIMPKPPVSDNPDSPWPYYQFVLKTSSSHKEGCERRWALDTRKFIGENGQVTAVEVEEVKWEKDQSGRLQLIRTGNVDVIQADLVFLAMGFVHPVQEGLVEQLNLAVDGRKNIAVSKSMETSYAKVFAAGDAIYGAGLVVRSIASGRDVAKQIHYYLDKKKD
ncbi:MAG: glutamate synthase subunit beta [Paludibacteraceae bacterium]|nr:glutamate synthase subunit beta [Paludibacteraceae bacterium]MBP9648356.1 glutamate synthase subunit beta [Paludibacteraceae bacterium]MBP9970390.1 glutamate synthase subunit beta [Paludibacteraceae bacterium]